MAVDASRFQQTVAEDAARVAGGATAGRASRASRAATADSFAEGVRESARGTFTFFDDPEVVPDCCRNHLREAFLDAFSGREDLLHHDAEAAKFYNAAKDPQAWKDLMGKTAPHRLDRFEGQFRDSYRAQQQNGDRPNDRASRHSPAEEFLRRESEYSDARRSREVPPDQPRDRQEQREESRGSEEAQKRAEERPREPDTSAREEGRQQNHERQRDPSWQDTDRRSEEAWSRRVDSGVTEEQARPRENETSFQDDPVDAAEGADSSRRYSSERSRATFETEDSTRNQTDSSYRDSYARARAPFEADDSTRNQSEGRERINQPHESREERQRAGEQERASQASVRETLGEEQRRAASSRPEEQPKDVMPRETLRLTRPDDPIRSAAHRAVWDATDRSLTRADPQPRLDVADSARSGLRSQSEMAKSPRETHQVSVERAAAGAASRERGSVRTSAVEVVRREEVRTSTSIREVSPTRWEPSRQDREMVMRRSDWQVNRGREAPTLHPDSVRPSPSRAGRALASAQYANQVSVVGASSVSRGSGLTPRAEQRLGRTSIEVPLRSRRDVQGMESRGSERPRREIRRALTGVEPVQSIRLQLSKLLLARGMGDQRLMADPRKLLEVMRGLERLQDRAIRAVSRIEEIRRLLSRKIVLPHDGSRSLTKEDPRRTSSSTTPKQIREVRASLLAELLAHRSYLRALRVIESRPKLLVGLLGRGLSVEQAVALIQARILRGRMAMIRERISELRARVDRLRARDLAPDTAFTLRRLLRRQETMELLLRALEGELSSLYQDSSLLELDEDGLLVRKQSRRSRRDTRQGESRIRVRSKKLNTRLRRRGLRASQKRERRSETEGPVQEPPISLGSSKLKGGGALKKSGPSQSLDTFQGEDSGDSSDEM